jgi:preprotein translocase subunit SecG
LTIVLSVLFLLTIVLSVPQWSKEEQTTQWSKEEVERTNNDLQNIHIKLKIADQ